MPWTPPPLRNIKLIAAGGTTPRLLADWLDDAVNVLGFIPDGLRTGILLRTSTTDVLAYLQAASDYATIVKKPLYFPAGRYATFGELYVIDTSLTFDPGVELWCTRDDHAGIVLKGDDSTVSGRGRLKITGAWPAYGGARRPRRGAVAPYNGAPYNQGFCRSPYRDRNSGVFVVSAHRARVLNVEVTNFNNGVHLLGYYTPTNSQPADGVSSDYCTDGTAIPAAALGVLGAVPAGKTAAAVSWPHGTQNQSGTLRTYLDDVEIAGLVTRSCDMGVLYGAVRRLRIRDCDNYDATMVQGSPPHAVYGSCYDQVNYPNLEVVIENVTERNNRWSATLKLDGSPNIVTSNLRSEGCHAHMFLNDSDGAQIKGSVGRDIYNTNIQTTATYGANSYFATVADVTGILIGMRITVDSSAGADDPDNPYPPSLSLLSGTFVDAINGNVLTLNKPTVSAQTGVAVYVNTNSSSPGGICNFGSRRVDVDGGSMQVRADYNDPIPYRDRISGSRLLSLGWDADYKGGSNLKGCHAISARSASATDWGVFRTVGNATRFLGVIAEDTGGHVSAFFPIWIDGGDKSMVVDPVIIGGQRIARVATGATGARLILKSALVADGYDATNGLNIGTTDAVATLDGARTGTWTPVYVGATTAGTNTYSTQTGTWARIGNQVFARCRLTLGAAISSVGNMTIQGLPFTIKATIAPGAAPGVVSGVTLTSPEVPFLRGVVGGTSIDLVRRKFDTESNITAAMMGSAARFDFELVYETSDA